MTDTEIVLARARMRVALEENGISTEVATEVARGFDPEALDAARYLGRVLDGVEWALDAVCATSVCARIEAGR